MKKRLIFLFTLTLILGLAACGGTAGNSSAATRADPAYLGRYLCTGITMDELSMNPDGKWLQLNADGTVTIFLTEESDEAEWRLEGENLTITIAEDSAAQGNCKAVSLS